MPLPLTVSCSSKIHIGFTFLVPAHLGSPGKRAVKRVCVTMDNTANSYSQAPIGTVCYARPSIRQVGPQQAWISFGNNALLVFLENTQ